MKLLLLAVLALSSADPVSAQDWTRFRGPGGTGHGVLVGVPDEFTVDDMLWRIELPGPGHSSPVVRGDDVILTCMDEEASKRLVMCVSAEDGSERWVFATDFEPQRQHQLNSFASSTPALDDERTYVTWVTGGDVEALALDGEGELAWRTTLGPFAAQHGAGISPIVVGGVVVVGNDNEGPESALFGLDAKTGKTLWKHERTSSRAAYGTPAVVTADGAAPRIVFASTAHGLTCLDPSDGKVHWEQDGLFKERIVGSPVVFGDVVFVTAGSGGGGKESVALRMPRDAKTRPEIVYHHARALPYVPTPLVVGEHLILWNDGGIVSCLKTENGAEIWRERLDGRFFGSPVCDGERLFAMSMEGILFVLRAGATFEELARIELGEPSQATPAIAGGRMFLRTTTQLMAIGGEE